jgi:apolipoprotein D and lipocalin family protein
MKKYFGLLFTLIFVLSLSIGFTSGIPTKEAMAQEALPELQTVSFVDVQKYMGKWYEIAAIPLSFQANCAHGTTATYALNPKGYVDVLNQCYTYRGPQKSAQGKAFDLDPETNAKLFVTFNPLAFSAKGKSPNYWIIDLGPNYEYAVVGEPSRQYGWILARTCQLSPATLRGIIDRLEAQGYSFDAFKFTRQKSELCQ